MFLFYTNLSRSGDYKMYLCWEQSYIWWLTILLPLSNDPLALFNILYPQNKITILISITCGTVFVGYLLLFWLGMLERIIHDQSSAVGYKISNCHKIIIWVIFFLYRKKTLKIGFLFLQLVCCINNINEICNGSSV